MKGIATWIKKYWKNFDDSLINPPKQKTSNKNFKGQTVKKRQFGQGPQPTAQQLQFRTHILESQQIKIQPRSLRFKHFLYGMTFLAWYIGATLFIMYRMKGDDLDSLEKQVKMRQQRKRDLGV